jgi:nickel transport protein
VHLKSIVILFFSSLSLFAHGIFYEVEKGAMSVRITSANNLAISDAKVKVYAPGGSLAYARGYTDINGNFAFMPDSKGKWLVKVTVSSDHGDHHKSFYINITNEYEIKDFEKIPLERYFGIISVLGIIFGIFGLFSYIRIKKS